MDRDFGVWGPAQDEGHLIEEEIRASFLIVLAFARREGVVGGNVPLRRVRECVRIEAREECNFSSLIAVVSMFPHSRYADERWNLKQ